MTSDKNNGIPDLNTLAIEACDMWQEHLSSLANDPGARAELTRFLEPQRRLFADWATMMQQGINRGGDHDAQPATENGKSADATEPRGSAADTARGSAANTTSRGAAHGDDPLRAAQLALRLAELEKRVVELEAKLAGTAKRTQRTAS